jgi:hypothetical protein
MMKSVEIAWDDLVDAFENSGNESLYFLDLETGEMFTVPMYYDDPEFWEDIAQSGERYLQVPTIDRNQERYIVYDFIRKVEDPDLKRMLEETFVGRKRYGKFEEILSFYPEEMDRLRETREEVLTGRIRGWLEEHDIFPFQENK